MVHNQYNSLRDVGVNGGLKLKIVTHIRSRSADLKKDSIHSLAFSMSANEITELQYIWHADTNNFQHARCSDGRISCNVTNEYSNVQFFHSSAVKLKNAEVIFLGILPVFIGKIQFFILS